jgi:hypothetical protein
MPELLSQLADAKLPETWRVPAWAIFEPADGSGPGFVAFHFQSWDERRGEHAPPEVVIREYRRERGGWGIWTSMLFELDTALGIGQALGRIERGEPAEPIELPSLAALTVEDAHDKQLSKHLVPVNKSRVVIVYHLDTAGYGVVAKIVEYKRRSGWQIDGYDLYTEKLAFALGTWLRSLAK